MARIKMLKMAAGPEGNRNIGSVHTVDDDTALAFVEAGAAVLLDELSPIERAVITPPETAVAPAQVSRRRR